MMKDKLNALGTMEVLATCRFCGTTHTLTVDINDYFNWQEGTHIQDAMPYLTPAERELLISQTCEECWDRMFEDIKDFDFVAVKEGVE